MSANCAALRDGDIERAAQELSDELGGNLGQLVAMLPVPLTAANVESVDRTGSGFRAVLHLVGETAETRLETRWKERDGRPIIVVTRSSPLAARAVAQAGLHPGFVPFGPVRTERLPARLLP